MRNCEASNPIYSFILPYRLLRMRGITVVIINTNNNNTDIIINNVFITLLRLPHCMHIAIYDLEH